MGPKKRKTAAQANPPHAQPNSLDWMRDALQCPVCLELIQDPPVYVCENPQGHSVCSKCHEFLMKEKKPCPVCRGRLANRRSIGLEAMVDRLPNKVSCQFDGCVFKKSDGAAVKKHEEDCSHRYVPCAKCDAKVGLQGLAEHVIKAGLFSTFVLQNSFYC